MKREGGGGQWVLRVTVHGRWREMGLGAATEISLKDARATAAKWCNVAAQQVDPIKQREKDRRAAQRNLHILANIAKDAFESRKAELKGDGEAGRWWTPLKLGKVPVAEIDQTDIRHAIAPIWHSKADIAKKALNRLAICLKHRAALGLDVDLQAVDKALLGVQRHKAVSVPSVSWREVAAFYSNLNEGSITHLALRLLILTGVRSALEQIDGDIWTIRRAGMMGRKGTTPDFRVPLSPAALAIIEQATPLARDGCLFPSVRKGLTSDTTMSRLMERRGII